MEEQYLNIRRRRPEAQREPPRRAAPSRRTAKARRATRARGSGAASVAMGFYKGLVVVSALIVAVYVGFSLIVKAPEQKQLPPPNQNGTQVPVNSKLPVVDEDKSGMQEPDGPQPLNRREGVYTVLLAATDKDGTRTDTMMVACYDTVKQTVGIVSVPRDTLIARENEHPHLVYGKGGVEQRVKDISQMLGIPIDGYVKVNIKGFITLVDYLGGIDFYVPCDMDYDDPIQDLHIHYKEGQRKLSGQQAMEVARFRKNNPDENGRSTGYSDTGRTQTQQKLLVALGKKVLSWNSLTKVNGFVEIFNKNVSTDLTLDNMLYFASQAMGLDPSTAVETATLEGNGFGQYRNNIKTYKYCYELDPEKTVETVNRLINPYDRALTLEDMNIAKADKYHN